MQNTTLTEEQKALRIGHFTASTIYKLMKPKGIGAGGMTYIIEKAAEFMTGQRNLPEFTSKSTQWGIDHEEEAKAYFKAATGLEITKSETLSYQNDGITCLLATPDGEINKQDCGFEIKCPYNSGNHLKCLLLENQEDLLEFKEEWFWQIYAGMFVTGLNKWKFCSYDPRFKQEKRMLILNIDLIPEHLTLLKNRVTEAKLIFDNILTKI